GVVAALSVHLQPDRAATVPRADHPEQMYIDIGARSEAEARAAGVDLLDPITLEKSFTDLGKGRVSAPWISGRAGTEALVEMALLMRRTPPAGTVTLAFVSQQYNGNAGLARVLARVQPDRIVWLKPGGGVKPAVAPVADRAPQMADQIAALAAKRKLDLDRDSAARLDLPAFASEEIWKQPERAASLTLGVENAGTPVEVLSSLSPIFRLLEDLAGIQVAGGEGGSIGKGAFERPVLERLIEVSGVSGHEAPVRRLIQTLLPEWARRASRVDDKGNLIVAVGEKPERLFLAHMDELGFEVTEVESNGRLWATSHGGGTIDFFEWHAGMVHTDSRSLPAILLASQGGGLSPRVEVDIGATSEQEAAALGVKIGSTVTARKKLRPLLGTRVNARSLDDRAGCAALLELLRSLRPDDIKQPSWFVFTVDEETGLHGAEFLAESVHPKEVYALDTFVSSDSPLENHRFADARLGEGFVIRAIDSSGMTPREAVMRVAELARRHNIPVQYGVTSGANDGSKFVAGGAVNIPLGWPLRYSHSPAEVADLADAEALGKILRVLATEP
ncbi:MAG TPA: M20/M25/M40 family metallo-hydrolase, partial [Stellaceae bacterium]|nr:M20/M25/M40 family metallo-hydrolase [Stellaceae bacterium]